MSDVYSERVKSFGEHLVEWLAADLWRNSTVQDR
jgi:hypothetical protein